MRPCLPQTGTIAVSCTAFDWEGVLDSDVQTASPPPDTEKTLSLKKPVSILFVDDEEELVEMNVARLSRMGYKMIGSTSGPDALAIFKAAPMDFDLVITDYSMPYITGLDLAKEILAIRPDILIILLSGFDKAIALKKVRQAGIKAYASKVTPREELQQLICQVMEGKEVGFDEMEIISPEGID
jgi:CheY-like chemotaxis protein